MNKWLLILVIAVYMIAMFALAYLAERNNKTKSIFNHPMVYVLGLGVYCTAWTYYGSVGVAATKGVEFLPIYLGPIIAIPLWMVVMRKVIRVSKDNNVASIADFISLRYGNSRSLGAMVAIVCIIAIIPYISLQLKAISESFQLITENHITEPKSVLRDSAFYIAVTLAVFAVIFGSRSSDASDERRGILFVVAVESFIKLIFFLCIGMYVTQFVFDGANDVFEKANKSLPMEQLTSLSGIEQGVNWYFMIVLSMFAIFLLPRQFQMTVLGNSNLKQLKTAIWGFPLYLLLFNLFVPFIAWAGLLKFGQHEKADYFSLMIPLQEGNTILALIVFMGGLSAVVSMIVVSTIALSTMLTNNIIIPYGLLKQLQKNFQNTNQRIIKRVRQISVFLLILAAYFVLNTFRIELSLFSIGLVAFLIIAQLAPSFLVGLFWSRGSALGAKLGILAGLFVVTYTYILPFTLDAVFANTTFQEQGLFSIEFLKPFQLFGIDYLDPIPHAFLWSIFFNLGVYLVVSAAVVSDYRERNYAEMVVNSLNTNLLKENAFVWKGKANYADIKKILDRFISKERADRAISIFKKRYDIQQKEPEADAKLINFSEKLLTGIIGTASAKILLSNVIEEHPVSLRELLGILEENKQTLASNKQLHAKSYELKKLAKQLQVANEELVHQDQQKDSFLDTVAHELKTPISSIQASSELLTDEDMPEEMRQKFLENIQADTQRITKLINNILNFEKLSSGREKLTIKQTDFTQVLENTMARIQPIADKKGVNIHQSTQGNLQAMIDEDKFVQVLSNLLSNSVKFIENGNGSIMVDARELNNKLLISVEDNGKGFTPEDVPYVFDKFYQAKNQNLRKPSGSGLGLAICKQIIELHGGKIWVDESYQKGAKINFEIPKENETTT